MSDIEKPYTKRFHVPANRRKILITGTGRVSKLLKDSWEKRKSDISLLPHADCTAGLIPECGVMIHAGARVFAHLSADDPGAYVEDNIMGTYRLLEHVRVTVPRIKFVYISTIEAEHPSNPYSATKAAAELLVRAYQHTFNIYAIVIRTPNLFLPTYDDRGYVGGLMNGTITEPREPGRKRQWIEGEDFADRVWIHLSRKMNSMEIVTLKGEKYTDQQIAEFVLGWKQGIGVKI